MSAAVISYLTSRAWAMEPQHLRDRANAIAAALEHVPAESLRALAQQRALVAPPAGGERKRYKMRGTVAHIPIAGVMLKEVPCIFELFGMQACSTADTREIFEAAVLDEDVTAIVLDIDSPGGSMAGVQELADAVYAARGLKPVTARISDLCASAAYWVASQAETVVANETAMVGSIGVYSVMEDSSAAFAAHGVKVHVVRSHELKGAGVDGDSITEAQLQDAQRVIDGAADLFVAAVSRGRGLDAGTVRELATGQVWFAGQARDSRLIDGLASAPSQTSSSKSTTQLSVSQETSMTTEEIEKLKADKAKADAEIARLKAINESHEANARALAGEAKKLMLDKYADRFMPAARGAFEKLAETMDADGLEAHLKALPKVTRAAVAEILPTLAERASKEKLEAITSRVRGVGGKAGASQVARWLETSVDRLDRYANVVGWQSNDTFVMDDGRVLTREELKRETAAA